MTSRYRLYVGNLSSRVRTRDLEDLFVRYGYSALDCRVCDDVCAADFATARSAAASALWSTTHRAMPTMLSENSTVRHKALRGVLTFACLLGYEFEGRRLQVEFARDPRAGPRGPAPGTGKCFNCGKDGHWARDCQSGDWR